MGLDMTHQITDIFTVISNYGLFSHLNFSRKPIFGDIVTRACIQGGGLLW